tara:strand:+ start:12349 stop:12936 length:588 start_codon:yes stop_codon:yes gene_type:complete
MGYDIRLLTLAADTLLKTTTKPLHRRILENYRRHAMLEVSGRYHEIFLPEMTVEKPFYRVATPVGIMDLDGETAVKGFYQSLIDSGTTVMLLEEENIIVSDWGFASEALYKIFMTAEAATAAGHVVDDPKGKYIESRMICMMWPYDEKGRLIGERVYPAATCTIEKCAEEDFISLEKARAVFDPLIAESRLTEVA